MLVQSMLSDAATMFEVTCDFQNSNSCILGQLGMVILSASFLEILDELYPTAETAASLMVDLDLCSFSAFSSYTLSIHSFPVSIYLSVSSPFLRASSSSSYISLSSLAILRASRNHCSASLISSLMSSHLFLQKWNAACCFISSFSCFITFISFNNCSSILILGLIRYNEGVLGLYQLLLQFLNLHF